MIYNLLILNAVSGVNIANIKISEKGVDDGDSHLMSGVIKAIESFFKELDMGEIKTFITNHRKVCLYQEKGILSALLCDESDNIDLYFSKIKNITNLFNSKFDMETWSGDTELFSQEIEQARQILTLTEKDLIEILQKLGEKMLEAVPEIHGYKILKNSQILVENLRNTNDFELSTFFSSQFFNLLLKKKEQFESSILHFQNTEQIFSDFIDYGKFSIFSKTYDNNLALFFFLPGKKDPFKFQTKFSEISTREGVKL